MKKIKYSIAALALAMGSFSVAGCGPAGAYSNLNVTYADQDCTATPDNPVDTSYPTTNGTGIHTAHGSLTENVVGSVWISCDPSPLQHIIDVELWFHPIEGYDTFKMVASDTYRNIPSQENATLFIVSRWCQAGIWEVRWSVVGRDNEGNPYTYSERWTYAFVKYSDCDHNATPEPTTIHTEGEAPVDPE
jgi:hypothetical protein